jgi:putative nucleotidyltransferase with HDIG domain
MTRTAARPLAPEHNRMLDAGAQAHCKRVAAWCEELALKMGICAHEAAALQEAALMHHHPVSFLQNTGTLQLVSELGLQTETPRGLSQLLSVEAEHILRAFRGKHPRLFPRQARRLARLLEAANNLDEQFEFAPFEEKATLQQAPNEPGQRDRVVRFVLRYLRKADRADLDAVIPALPVYADVVIELYRLIHSGNVVVGDLARIATSDPAIASRLVRSANSDFYSPAEPIRSVKAAIDHVGMDCAVRIMLAAAVRPLYAAPRLQRIWKHAIEAAQVAEQIASRSGKVDPSEAFLAGLLHDVGKLAIALLPPDVNSSLDRLILKGCESSVAEAVVCGFDHAEAGAAVLTAWQFDEELVTAIRDHHAPNRSGSVIAAILYLTEYWTDSEEDIPSNARLDSAFELAGLKPRDLYEMQFSYDEWLTAI